MDRRREDRIRSIARNKKRTHNQVVKISDVQVYILTVGIITKL